MPESTQEIIRIAFDPDQLALVAMATMSMAKQAGGDLMQAIEAGLLFNATWDLMSVEQVEDLSDKLNKAMEARCKDPDCPVHHPARKE